MAVHLNNTTYYTASGLSFPHNATFTIMGWVYYPTTASSALLTIKTTDNGDNLGNVEVYTTAGVLQTYTANDAGGNITLYNSGSTTITAGWHHIAVVRESDTALKVYLDGTLEMTDSGDISARTGSAACVRFPRSATGSAQLDGRFAAWKAWDVALTGANVVTEQSYRNAQTNTGNVWAEWHFDDAATGTADTGGSSRTLTATNGGSATDTADPAGILGDDPTGSSITTISSGYHQRGLR